MEDIEVARPYLCYPFGVAETLHQDHGIHSLTQIIEERSETFFEPVVGMPYKGEDDKWTCRMYTYKDILNGVNALCHYFLKHKILPERTKSDGLDAITVALVAPSNLDMLMSMLAMQRLGLGVLLITPNQTHKVIRHLCIELKVVKTITPMTIDGLDCHPLPPSAVWEDAITKPQKSYQRALSPAQEGETTGVVYHTSGTTSGLPKPLPTKHKFLVSFCAHKHTKLATLTTTPLNTGGNADVCRSMSADAMLFLFPDSVPLTSANVIEARNASSKALGREVRALSSVPYVAKMLAEDERALAMLQRLEFLGVGGAPLPKATGDFIVNSGVPLVSRMGSSECNFLMCSYRDYKNDKDWDYLRSEPGGHHFKFIPQEDGSGNCELEVSGSWPALAVATNHNGNFRTGDLFQPHPTTPDAWLYLGRNDDTIVLGNGKKADPRSLEGALRGLKYINNALVFGTGKNNIGVLVIESMEPLAPKGDALRDMVWNDVIQVVNRSSPSHAEVYHEMVIIVPPSKDFEKTPKGTVFRNGTYAKFEEEINAAYDQKREAIDVSDERLDKYISDVVMRTSEKDLEPDTDLFNAGVNSLQSVRIRNILAGELDLDIPSNIVFEQPSIKRLITYIRSLRAGNVVQAEDVSSLMHNLVMKYSYNSASQAGEKTGVDRQNKKSESEVILLTGATGGLGTHLLASLVERKDCTISEIICLVRTTSTSPEARVQEALKYRKIDLAPATSVKVTYLSADLTKADFGLSESQYTDLCNRITLIVHAAWPVNFNASLASFESSIISTHNLLSLLPHNKGRFYFCSSTASTIRSDNHPIPETPSSKTQDSSTVGYAQSKWVTEQVVLSYATKYNVGVLRIGQLCGDTHHGVWSESEAWSLMFATINILHALPDLVEERIAWLPVDKAAGTICDITLNNNVRGQQIWHIVNPAKGTSWRDILQYCHEAGWHFKIVPPKTWVDMLAAAPESVASKKLLGLWHASYSNDVPLQSDPVFDTTHAEQASETLRQTRAMDAELMTKILQNWKDRGFLE